MAVLLFPGCSSRPDLDSAVRRVATTGDVASSSSLQDASSTSLGEPHTELDPLVGVARLTGRISFSYDDGVWVSAADGSNRVRLTADGGFDPSWSPDGTQIVYRLLTPDDDGELWVMDSDGSNRHDLVHDPAFSDWGPAWSPDGSRIAFDSNRDGGLAIWMMDADGSNQRIVTGGHGEYPTWSPDSASIAYAGGAYYDIRLTDSGGTNDRVVVADPAYEMGPAWSPDGQWIAYHTQADFSQVGEKGMGPEMEIHLVHPDGSDDRRVTNDRVEDNFAVWSPDSHFLMWSRHGQLVVARPDGSGLIQLGPGNFASWIE
jgi:Tol biopolymer transport system component